MMEILVSTVVPSQGLSVVYEPSEYPRQAKGCLFYQLGEDRERLILTRGQNVRRDFHLRPETQKVTPISLLILVAIRDDSDTANRKHGLAKEREASENPVPSADFGQTKWFAKQDGGSCLNAGRSDGFYWKAGSEDTNSWNGLFSFNYLFIAKRRL